MSDNEKFSFEIGSEGGKLEASGSTASTVSEEFLNLISPFTQSAGAIGDVVRMFRQEAAIRGLSRARSIANKLGVEIQPVPPKYLVSWVEGASLEEEESLSDLWAGLLVSSSDETSPSDFRFMRILREMTKHHAEFFEYICNEKFSALSAHHLSDRYAAWNECVQRSDMRFDLGLSLDDFRVAASRAARPGMKVAQIVDGTGGNLTIGLEEEVERWVDDGFAEFWNNGTVSSLIASDLVQKNTIYFSERAAAVPVVVVENIRKFAVDIISLTDDGVDFLKACLGAAKNA